LYGYLCGFINTKGNIIEPKYLSAGDFDENNQACVEVASGIYTLIDKNGLELAIIDMIENGLTIIGMGKIAA